MKIRAITVFVVINLLAAFVYMGCQKDDQKIRITGNIMDIKQNITLEEVEVILSAKLISNGVFNPFHTVVTSVKTDSEGNYSINIDKIKGSEFKIEIKKSNYFKIEEEVADDEIMGGKEYNKNFQLYPIGYLNLHIKHHYPPMAGSDVISYAVINSELDCDACCSKEYKQGTLLFFETTEICQFHALDSAKIVWHITKQGNYSMDSAVIAIPLFDTAYHEILY